jgi:CBS domain-containing protein
MPTIKRLQETEPFNQLPEDAFVRLREAATLHTLPENTDIFRQNDSPTGFLYVIKSGLVAVTVISPGGLDMTVDYRNEGQMFGGTPIFTGEPYSGGARTVKETECYLIPQQVLHDLQKSYPQLGSYFTHIVLSRVRNLYSEIVSEHSGAALTQMESYPFKKRLSEIMTAPVVTCTTDTSVRDVARRLTGMEVNGLVVVSQQDEPVGLLTERDLVAKVLAPEDVPERELTAQDVMQQDPHTMSPHVYMYEAMAHMTRHQLTHLPIVDHEQLVGIVTLSDLMRYRSQKALLLLGNIREVQALEGLAAIRKELVKVARSLLSETRSTPEVMEILSHMHHALIRRTYEICLEEFRDNGMQPPNIRYCFLIMGSGGRREMLLDPDQDNGFIFENVPDSQLPEVEAFFGPFGKRLSDALDQVGYPYCDGGVMASNPAWRGRLQDWQDRISSWLLDPDPAHVRNSSIFFDFLPLLGDASLADELRDVLYQAIRSHQGFLYHMMSLDLRYKVPLGLLGRFIVEKSGEQAGKLSVKYGGSVYITDCVRMFALEREVQQLSTLDRLDALVKDNVFAVETAEHIRAAFEALAFLRLRHEIDLLENGEEPSHFLDPTALTKTEQDLLRESFQAVSKLQDATKRHFARTPF